MGRADDDSELKKLQDRRSQLLDRLAEAERRELASPLVPLPGNPGKQHPGPPGSHIDRNGPDSPAAIEAEIKVVDTLIQGEKARLAGLHNVEQLEKLLPAFDGNLSHATAEHQVPAPQEWHANHLGTDLTGAVMLGIVGFQAIKDAAGERLDAMDFVELINTTLDLAKEAGVNVKDTVIEFGKALADKIVELGHLTIAGLAEGSDRSAEDVHQQAEAGAARVEAMAAQMDKSNEPFAERTQNKTAEEQAELMTSRVGTQLQVLVEVAEVVAVEIVRPEPARDDRGDPEKYR
jgi:hypothetical protein